MESIMFVLMVCGQFQSNTCTPTYFRTLPACEFALSKLPPAQSKYSFCTPLGGGKVKGAARHV